MPQIPCEAVVIIDQNEQDNALFPAGKRQEEFRSFFVYVTFLQAFAKAAKLAIISMKLARRTRTGNPRGKCVWQMLG